MQLTHRMMTSLVVFMSFFDKSTFLAVEITLIQKKSLIISTINYI